MTLPKTAGIYKITNTTNGKYYLGSSNSIKTRYGTHFSKLRRDDHPNKHLQASFNKYGEGAFIFEVVEDCLNLTLEDVRLLEQKYLDQITDWGVCYNMLKLVNYPTPATPFSLTTREQMSVNNTGERNPNFGKRLSKEASLELSKAKRVCGSGVTETSTGSWSVTIKITFGGNKKLCLGTFKTEKLARLVRKTAEEFYFDDIPEKKIELDALLLQRVGFIKNGNHLGNYRQYGAGVCLSKHNTWRASIFCNDKSIDLGNYATEEQARKVRQLAEKIYWDGDVSLMPELEKAKLVANTKNNQKRLGVGVNKNGKGTYSATIRIDNKTVHLGNFKTEEEAREFRDKAEKYYYNGDQSFYELFNQPEKERELPVGITIRGSKYRASLYAQGKLKQLGTFSTVEEALKARKAAKLQYAVN
jgi:group I intron endonuclease